jgi:hypothetical protein
MSEGSTVPMKKRSGRFWYILLGLALTPVVAFVVFRLVLGSKVQARINALREAGYPVTLQELDAAYETPPYGQNAAEYIIGAVTSMPVTQDGERLSVPLFDEAGFPARTEPLGQETEALIVELAGEHEDAFEFVRRAAPIQASRYPIDLTKGFATLLPYLSDLRELVRLLCAKAALHAERAEADLATETLVHALAVPRSLSREPLIVSQMVRNSQHAAIIQTLERVVSRTQLSGENIRRLDEALAGAYDPNATATAMIGEACIVLDTLHNPQRAGLHLAGSSDDGGLSLILLEVCRALGLLDLSRLRYADLAADQLAALRRPLNERIEAAAQVSARIQEVVQQDRLLREFAPNGGRFIVEDVANAARLMVARTALAVERYRLEAGELPARLDDLVPAFLEQVPQDPFDGKPVRYITQPRRYVVYSIGKDRTDDGGKERPPRRRGSGPDPTYDMTFTVEW